MTEAAAPKLDLTTAINAVFMVICTCLLPLVILGFALFYSGLTQRRSSFAMLSLPILLVPFVFIDWFIWGYSLCYGSSSNRFIGSLKFTVLRHIRDDNTLIYSTPRGDILSINHFLFNGLMKVICASFTFPGCIAERGRVLPMLVFLFFWSCIIYNPVTYWFWNRNGWLSEQLGYVPVLDFAGGNCIHVVSGFTALAYSYLLGPRNPKILYNYRSSNFGYLVIGTFFIACGWCGFISGCSYKFSTLSIFMFTNTILCSFTSGLVWMMIDYYYSAIPLEGSHLVEDSKSQATSTKSTVNRILGMLIRKQRHVSIGSFCTGVVTGLVVQTPAGGYTASPTEFWKSFVLGAIGAVVANYSTRLKYFMNIDDALDLFAIHGVAGIAGSVLLGFFANDLYGSDGGWIRQHWIQLGYQIAGCVVTSAYVFVVSFVILYIIDNIPGLHLRIDKDFNKRMREQKKATSEGSTELESQSTPHTSYTISPLENAELMGMDWYEFNCEFSQDYMEFIKVLQPEDYQEAPEHEMCNGIGGDYEVHEGNAFRKER